jgi:riboflavin kinase/FMN adenylyltransferase
VLRWFGANQVPQKFGPCVATLGNFDGVHIGHQTVLAKLVERGLALNQPTVAVTFDPHPSTIHRPDKPAPAIQSLSQRLDLLATHQLDAALVLPYTAQFAQMTPAEFAQRYLVECLKVQQIVVGLDIQFGKGNQGNRYTLRRIGEQLGFAVETIDDVGEQCEGCRPRWSSSAVRLLLGEGDVAEAGRILGRDHRLTGTVVPGDGRGRQLGFPTANLGGQLQGMVPADGLYAGWLTVLDPHDHLANRAEASNAIGRKKTVVYPAAISIGVNPTFGGRQRRVEAHVPGRDDLELYGQTVAVDFVARLRHTLRFANSQALVSQMADDVTDALAVLRAQRSGSAGLA